MLCTYLALSTAVVLGQFELAIQAPGTQSTVEAAQDSKGSPAGDTKQGELVQKRIEAYRRGWAELAKKRIAGLDEIEALVDRALEGIEIAQLSPLQIARLSNAGLLNDPARRKLARPVLEGACDAPTLAGVLACHLLLQDRPFIELGEKAGDGSEVRFSETRALLGALLEHPKLGDAFASPEFGMPFSTLFQRVPVDVILEFRREVLDCADWIRPESSPGLLSDLKTYFDLLRRVGEPEDEDRIQRIRTRLVTVLRTAVLASANRSEGDPERDALSESLRRNLKFLESPLASGSLLGAQAPALELIGSLNTDVQRWSELKGRVLVLEFWTTHCAPCVKTRPKLSALHRHFEDQPVEIIGVTSPQGFVPLRRGIIDCQDDPEKELELMREYLVDSGIEWPVLFTKEDAYNVAYGASSLPHLVVVDGTGRFRTIANPVTEPLEDLIAKIDDVLRDVGTEAE